MLPKKFQSNSGFTLIELLIVIAIIAILAVTVFVALNPVQRFSDARDSRRWADVNNLLTAVHEYIVDNDGSLPSGLTNGMTETQLGTAGTGCDDCGGSASCLDMSTTLQNYLASIPIDPQGTAEKTGYSVVVNNNIVTIRACNAEEVGTTIAVSR